MLTPDRIFFVTTGTHGEVQLSAGVESVSRLTEIIPGVKVYQDIHAKHSLGCLWKLEYLGYTGQKYSIKLKDIRREVLHITNFYTRSTGRRITRTPQSFCICDIYVGMKERASNVVLLPIHEKWARMILEGKKVVEFRNRIPKEWRA